MTTPRDDGYVPYICYIRVCTFRRRQYKHVACVIFQSRWAELPAKPLALELVPELGTISSVFPTHLSPLPLPLHLHCLPLTQPSL